MQVYMIDPREIAMPTKLVWNLIFINLIGGLMCTAATSQPQRDSVTEYHVRWDSPSQDSSGSMPLGNGEISLNAWMEPSSDLQFYIGKTDSWGDNGRLLKVGKVRVSLTPNPLTAGSEFLQVLSLETGEMVVTIQQGSRNLGSVPLNL